MTTKSPETEIATRHKALLEACKATYAWLTDVMWVDRRTSYTVYSDESPGDIMDIIQSALGDTAGSVKT